MMFTSYAASALLPTCSKEQCVRNGHVTGRGRGRIGPLDTPLPGGGCNSRIMI